MEPTKYEDYSDFQKQMHEAFVEEAKQVEIEAAIICLTFKDFLRCQDEESGRFKDPKCHCVDGNPYPCGHCETEMGLE